MFGRAWGEHETREWETQDSRMGSTPGLSARAGACLVGVVVSVRDPGDEPKTLPTSRSSRVRRDKTARPGHTTRARGDYGLLEGARRLARSRRPPQRKHRKHAPAAALHRQRSAARRAAAVACLARLRRRGHRAVHEPRMRGSQWSLAWTCSRHGWCNALARRGVWPLLAPHILLIL